MFAINQNKPLFDLGKTVATPGALEALTQAVQAPTEFLGRHVVGDWGEILSDEDRQLNDDALKDGARILSAYRLTTGVKIRVISEAVDDDGQRAVTTILLPEEY